MKNIFKRSIWVSSVFLLMFTMNSCLQNTDLVTENAKNGGLVIPSGLVPYKLGVSPAAEISFTVPKGAPVKTVKVSYYYMRMSDTVASNTLSFDVAIDGANATEAVTKNLSYTWSQLIAGIVLPSAPQIPATDVDPTIAAFIGDYWEFSYTSIMEDGREIVNNSTTLVSIANFFAGTYNVTLLYFHPTAGGTYPTSAYGGVRSLKLDLTPTSPYDCWTYFGVWTDNMINIHIDATNAVTITFDRADGVSGDPYDATNLNTYDPATGVIQIYYHYYGASGPRIFWETFTPKQ